MARHVAWVALGSAFALASTMVAAAPAASAAECWVLNTHSGEAVTSLGEAVAASEPGDTLKVKGTCGWFGVEQGADVTLQGPATVDLDGFSGISNGGRLVLNHIDVTGGYSTVIGGGIYNEGTGTLLLRGRTTVTSNLAEDGGGGIYNEGTVIMEGRSAVTANRNLSPAADGIMNVGNLVLKDQARVADHSGLGVGNSGTMTMSRNSSVAGNRGGVSNFGTLTMTGNSSVVGNIGGSVRCDDQGTCLWGVGGGVDNAGTLTMTGNSSVAGNEASTGGGVYNTGTLGLSDRAKITGNTASESGGGIFSEGEVSFAPKWRGTVCGNTPDDWPGCA